MADIFHEIDEDLRRERFSRLWSRYGIYVIGLAVLIVAAVAGWRGYEWWKLREDQAAGARFEAALQLANQGKTAEADAAFAEIAKDGPRGYRILARFRSAADLAATDPKAAVAAYDSLATDASLGRLMQDLAQVRAGFLLVDTAPLAEIEQRLRPLDTPDGAFRFSAREIIGLAQYKAGDFKAAGDTFTAILNDGQTPPGLRQTAELMRNLAGAQMPTPAPEPVTPAPAGDATSAPAAPAVQ